MCVLSHQGNGMASAVPLALSGVPIGVAKNVPKLRRRIIPKIALSSATREFVDTFLCGCVGGVANILSSHPLDTIKVRMQLLDMRFRDCLSYTVTHEGSKALYKGVTSPLFNVPIIYAIIFGSYEFTKYQLEKQHGTNTLMPVVIAGGVSGLASSIVQTPVELVKCRLQMDGTGRKADHMSATAMMKEVYKKEGVRGLLRGNLITLLREVPAGMAYFGSYEYIKSLLEKRYGGHQFVPLLAGGSAGLLSWAVSYPQDLIKSKIQCDVGLIKKYPNNKYIHDGGIIACIREIYAMKGLAGFTKGFSACAVRAVISEAATFSVFENTKEYIEG